MKHILLIIITMLVSASAAQTLGDIDKGKVRLRIKVMKFTVNGVVCGALELKKNKMGREEVSKSKDIFSSGDPFSDRAPLITVIDLNTQPVVVGGVHDLTLYRVDPLRPEKGLFAFNATNALLFSQGKYHLQMTLIYVEKMGFDALVNIGKDGRTYMREAGEDPFARDPFGSGRVVKIIGTPSSPKVKLYPTALKGTFALSAKEAFKTWKAGN